jgi:hypothetical protein
MALIHGTDYVFCPKATYVGKLGVGDGCLIGTRNLLLLLPSRVDKVEWNRYIEVRIFQLGDDPVNVSIQRVLEGEGLTVDELEVFMRDAAAKLPGSEVGELTQMKRVRVRAGFFSRGIYYSVKDKGVGWKGYPLKGKAMAQSWVDFYKTLPTFVA